MQATIKGSKRPVALALQILELLGVPDDQIDRESFRGADILVGEIEGTNAVIPCNAGGLHMLCCIGGFHILSVNGLLSVRPILAKLDGAS